MRIGSVSAEQPATSVAGTPLNLTEKRLNPQSFSHKVWPFNTMDTIAHFKSIASELNSVRNRVRNFINDAHWQTDGEWKETVLRSVIRRLLPRTVEVGRGFVVSPITTSKQIDVMIYSGDKPVLFRDGDLAFITKDALLGVIEVKTRLDNHKYAIAAAKLADTIEQIGQSKRRFLTGIFVYEDGGTTAQGILDGLHTAARNTNKRVIDISSIGDHRFSDGGTIAERVLTVQTTCGVHMSYAIWHRRILYTMSCSTSVLAVSV